MTEVSRDLVVAANVKKKQVLLVKFLHSNPTFSGLMSRLDLEQFLTAICSRPRLFFGNFCA